MKEDRRRSNYTDEELLGARGVNCIYKCFELLGIHRCYLDEYQLMDSEILKVTI